MMKRQKEHICVIKTNLRAQCRKENLIRIFLLYFLSTECLPVPFHLARVFPSPIDTFLFI